MYTFYSLMAQFGVVLGEPKLIIKTKYESESLSNSDVTRKCVKIFFILEPENRGPFNNKNKCYYSNKQR